MRGRTAAMLERVADEARVLPHDEARLVAAALEHSLAWRDARLNGDHDPRLMHPARTIRILLADAAFRNAPALAAIAFLDSVDPELVPDYAPDTWSVRPGPGFASAAEALLTEMRAVVRDPEETLEALVTAPRDAALALLAERLDQVRHAHLRDDQSPERHLHEVRSVWAPAAHRLAPALARRFERWADATERRLITRRAGLP